MANALKRWRSTRRHRNYYGPARRSSSRGLSGIWERFGADTRARRLLLTAVGLFMFGSFVMAVLSLGLPNPTRLVFARPTESTQIYDRNGESLFQFYEQRHSTDLDFYVIPDNIKHAAVALEDKNFYNHQGIDYRGVARGAFRTVVGGDVQGGSTLTQQFVKNAVLTSEQTIIRKIKELILTFEIEKIYTKDKILEMYLNEIPWGGSAYGVEVAAKTYFGKSAKDVSLAQAATLVAMVQRPTYYSPYGSNVDRLMARKDYTLQQMLDQKYITKEEFEAAKKEPIEFVPRRDSIKAPHFVMQVRELLAAQFGERMVSQGGLKVITTLDYEKQQAAEKAVADRAEFNKKNFKATNAALVSLSPKTGEILAMVGSADYFNNDIDGAVNVIVRPRQPGSSIKPIIYAAAFEKGYNPATMLVDVVTDFGNNYIPKNYNLGQNGPVSIRYALGNSLNIPAVKTLAYVGVSNATKFAQKMGIKSLNDPDRYGLSLVLGGGEVTPLELATGYAVFANEGKKVEPVAILEVRDHRGRVIYKYTPPKSAQVLDPQIAYQISNILSDDSARTATFGAGSALTLPGRTVAAKTGTTDRYVDAWTAGYTPDLVSVVWVGNNNNSPMTSGGANAAAPVWNRYMREALKDVPNKQFNRPEGIEEIVVDRLSGKLPTSSSPETKKEIFASMNKPTEQDNIHVVKKVVAFAPDFLAPDGFPEALTMEKVFTVIHSERPDSPNWENPVLGWAKANGYNNVPTQVYDGTAEVGGNDQKLRITSPQNGQKVKGPFTVQAEASPEITKVEFFYDGQLIGSSNGPTFQQNINPGELDGNAHAVRVRGTGSGESFSYQIYVFEDKPKDEGGGG